MKEYFAENTVQKLREYLCAKKFIKTASNIENEKQSTTADIVFKFKKAKVIIYKSGFMNYQWLVRIMFTASKNETDISIEFSDDSKKWFADIAATIEFYAK